MLSERRFQVALSFAGENREFVGNVANLLAAEIGRERVFYDEFYEAELARPDLDIYIGDIYREKAELVVPFLCLDYERKQWCRLEWRQMRDILKRLEGHRLMPFRFDLAEIPGLLSIDGYVEIRDRTPTDVAKLILQRIPPAPTINQTVLTTFPGLTITDCLILEKACEEILKEEDPTRRLKSETIFEAVKSFNISRTDFDESLEILNHRSYIFGSKVIRGDIPLLVVSGFVFEKFLQTRMPDYSLIIDRVAEQIVGNNQRRSDSVASILGVEQACIAHIFDSFESNRLISQSTLCGGPRVIQNVSVEFKRRMREVRRS